ncbi:MAG: hypothetical protein ACI8RZ_003136 [Myxococcota bacterium]|jgi:hypothetical protein
MGDNAGMSDPALAANIDTESTPERLSLYLPVDVPIWGSPHGVRSAMLLAGVNVVSCMGLSLLTGPSIHLAAGLLLATMLVVILLAVGALTLRDASLRLWQRKVDTNSPIRELRERIDLTLHAVVTDQGETALSAIQSVHVQTTPDAVILSAQTADGEVPIASHRTLGVIEALSDTIEQHARRRRTSLIADGIDPDDPEAIPEALQRLRSATASPQS